MLKVIIPMDPNKLDGNSITQGDDKFRTYYSDDKVVLIEFHSLDEQITWFEDFDLMYCQRQHDRNMIKVIREATDQERVQYRIPLWIQEEEVPQCCGKDMFFIGQLDDDRLCSEAPEDAELWWHDQASFYVFTCSQCLSVKAIGQQF